MSDSDSDNSSVVSEISEAPVPVKKSKKSKVASGPSTDFVQSIEEEKRQNRLAILARARESAQAKRKEIGDIKREEKLNKEKERLLKKAENQRKSDELDKKLAEYEKLKKRDAKSSKSTKSKKARKPVETSSSESDSSSSDEEEVDIPKRAKKEARRERDAVLLGEFNRRLDDEKWKALVNEVAGRS